VNYLTKKYEDEHQKLLKLALKKKAAKQREQEQA